MPILRLKLHWQILIAIALALAAGHWVGQHADAASVHAKVRTFQDSPAAGFALSTFDFLGKLFMNLLFMLIVPLVGSAIINGVAGLEAGHGFGRMGLKTVAWYLTTSVVAILIGMTAVNLIQPGRDHRQAQGVPPPATMPATAATAPATASAADSPKVAAPKIAVGDSEAAKEIEKVQGRSAADLVEVFLRMIPKNVLGAAASGDMLGVIFFSLLFGIFLLRVSAEYRMPVLGFFKGVYEVMIAMTGFVMAFAPLGVFGLVARVIAETGFEKIRNVGWFFLTVIIGLAVHMFVFLPGMLLIFGRRNPIRHFKAMAPALLSAFSSSSSSATLPLTIRCVEERAGVSRRVSGFVLPLGSAVNMDGTALYECVVVMFIAQAYGVDMSLGQQFLVLWMALLTSTGVAGIPSASLVAIAIILKTVGLPVEAIGIVWVVDRVLDMCRTAVNTFSDATGTVTIALTEGETNVLRDVPADPVTRPPAP